MQQGKQIIQNYKRRWQMLRGLEAVLYGLGVGIGAGCIMTSICIGLLLFVIITGIALLVIAPWKIREQKVSAHIDYHLQTAEYSTTLLLANPNGLSGLAQLQQHKITQHLATEISGIAPKTGLKRAALIASILMLLGYGISRVSNGVISSGMGTVPEVERITLQVTDSVAPNYTPPVIESQKLTIRYPGYTGVGNRSTSVMNVKAVEGSRLFWQLDFDGLVSEVQIEGFEDTVKMDAKDKDSGNLSFAAAVTPATSGYYNFRFTDTLGTSYASEIFAVEVVEDEAPTIEIKDIPQFTSFDYDDTKTLTFSAEISDDYGIAAAGIIATVSKGSGESVKFREEKLAFDQAVQVGAKSLRLSRTIQLEALKMEMGDELYFYVQATDRKTPRPNITRSETFFAVIRDTVSDGFGVEGTLGADLMPDYFRSQRQLIIDTERLIKEKPQLSIKEFKSRSNELGFDQKSLRLKYGQFMGDEADSGIAVTPEIDVEDYDEDDPTAGFRHDHDSDNEHNLVEDDHDHDHGHEHDDEAESESTEEKSILEGYVHNHDDPEESTLFTASLRSKLKQAMAEMWDAELYLRLATPKESLPYQYRALNLIQEIKNSARIYVHRIGFDPPPIKEETRLTGDVEEIDNFYKSEDLAKEELYTAMRESVQILERRIGNNGKLMKADKDAFAKAGEELATIAINEPAKHLKTLQQLKWLTEEKRQPVSILRGVQKGLLRALPEVKEDVSERLRYSGSLEKIFIQELQAGG